ncbi:hypothetical protein C4B63_135g33 [Trypanosoma cruzi]|uniref:Uncharacterized protein n=1 Tax=Trypanosoma cruzi TaxID=5693 RepID=A0A2V2UPS1_TRYCR|nr:hypothetical protein C4B63_135g33 [Trypanosoma cruzi]
MPLFSLRSSTWENFVLCGMESTRPLAHCRVVVSGSQDPVEYFVRAKDDGRTVMPAQSETRTGWLMSPVKLRSQLRHWMRAEQVALRCLLASRPSRWLIVKGIQEHSFPEGVSAGCSAHCSVCSIGLFLWWEDGLLHFLDPCGGEGHGATCPPFRCWRTAYLQPRYTGGMILRSRMKATCSRPLPAMNGLLVIYFWVFLPDNEFANGYEGFVAAGFERRFFF